VETRIEVLAFAGSLRIDSYNKALIRAAIEVAPENVVIEVFDLEGIPPFNQESESNPPQKVSEFKEKIKRRRTANRHSRIQLLNPGGTQERN
jgi:chromate reductase